MAKLSRSEVRRKKHFRIRKKISGTADKPRLCVFKSNKYFYAQLINDENGVTLASASSIEKDHRGNANKQSATDVGKRIAERALEKGCKEVVFDRSGYIYHGNIKAFADSAREAGLEF
ncbi:ribosomal protein L18 [Flexistipes sinusarabici DSM 4947]|uniref:Large ribosomal subunit protein uL18 n=1 Tax=Flexistipes sinusarabici (strain ATCC 49648 / DSM 4947 / MAS 10) TaxID=717231 RepID=F8E9B5_FLESM|nr:50S ribosomal protein L18 [Flexistipes sinusarabici]AEI14167.1 ribosomal protein L18 [Flexistipes sinusarabici DSM 4947]